MAFVYALMVPSWANQLLPQLLMEQFDTLPIQCSALDKLLGQLGIYATWLSSIAYLQKQLRIFFKKKIRHVFGPVFGSDYIRFLIK